MLTIKLIDDMDGNINIGLAIEQRINELGITKSEFGRRIGIPNQNVNRILSKSSIDSDKLVEICNALDYDFFKLYSSVVKGKTSLLNTEKVKSILSDKGMGVIKFASTLGVSRTEVEAILDGSDINLSMVEKMADVLGVQPTELITGASSNAEATDTSNAAMYEEIIALRAQNRLLRELQGMNKKKAVG